MSELFEKRSYLIREHLGFGNLYEKYDILDPADKRLLGIAEEKASFGCKVAKFFLDKNLLPLKVDICEKEDTPAITLQRPGGGFQQTIEAKKSDGSVFAKFKPSCCSLIGKFKVTDANDQEIGTVSGDWKGNEYQFIDSRGQTIGRIERQKHHFAREFFTSADTYLVKLFADQEQAPLLLAASIAVDLAFHEG